MIKSFDIDSTFHPTGLAQISFKYFVFSGGESHFKINVAHLYEVDKVVISNRIRTGSDIINIALVKDALERYGIRRFELLIPYLPYARQDRLCDSGEPLSIKVFASLINSLSFDKVVIFDAHSDVSLALINNITDLSNSGYVVRAFKSILDRPHLVFPDSGAAKKYYKLTEIFRDAKYPITCSKHRNPTNGKLSDFTIDKNPLKGANCLIVDDICDGGRTFMGVADKLNSEGAGDIYLFITHAIFSNGVQELLRVFKRIFCTNSFSDYITDGTERITQYKIYYHVTEN